MAKVKLLCIAILVVLLLPWYLSLGSAFSGYLKFNGEDHEIIIDAKSGVYRTTHIFEGIAYRTHHGIYTKIGDALIFLPLYGTYVDSFPLEFSKKILNADLDKYFRGFNYFRIKGEGKLATITMLKNGKIYPFDEFYLVGRLSL